MLDTWLSVVEINIFALGKGLSVNVICMSRIKGPPITLANED